MTNTNDLQTDNESSTSEHEPDATNDEGGDDDVNEEIASDDVT